MTKKVRKKRKKRVRERDWEAQADQTFSVDRAKHIRTGTAPQGDEKAPTLAEGQDPNALVVSATGAWAFVVLSGNEVLCRVPDAFMVGRASVLAPGDRVWVEYDEDTPFVKALAERRTKLSRYIRRSRIQEQVIAANADLLIIAASVREPRFKPGLVDRYLVAAQVGGVEPVLCINKMDLAGEEPPGVALFRDLGMRVVLTSCVTGVGLDELRDVMRGKVSVLCGHSGVGKSSILNALDPNLRIAVQDVSQYNEKGRHTTTLSRMYLLAEDAKVIDTPGIRNLGLWGVSQEEVAFYFPELAELGVECQFRDCSHTHEPQCAVRDAVDRGALSRLRYQSYIRIRSSLEQQRPEY